MSRNNSERVDDTLKFMTAHGANALAGQIRASLPDGAAKDRAGAYIKLDTLIKTDRDRARQALLLCRYMFAESRVLGNMTDWGVGCIGTKAVMLNHWQWKTTSTIMEGVKAYQRSATPGCMAAALESLGRNPGRTTFRYYDMSRRHHRNLGSPTTPICYQTITLALWMSGHASIAWLATWYASSNAGNCFDLMGDGETIDDVDGVLNLRGHVISFRNRIKKGSQYVNHWAIITGNGRAIGSNTDGFADAGKGERGEREFIWGDRALHEFDIKECYAACSENTKYRDSGGVRVATHRPMDMDLW